MTQYYYDDLYYRLHYEASHHFVDYSTEYRTSAKLRYIPIKNTIYNLILEELQKYSIYDSQYIFGASGQSIKISIHPIHHMSNMPLVYLEPDTITIFPIPITNDFVIIRYEKYTSELLHTAIAKVIQ